MRIDEIVNPLIKALGIGAIVITIYSGLAPIGRPSARHRIKQAWRYAYNQSAFIVGFLDNVFNGMQRRTARVGQLQRSTSGEGISAMNIDIEMSA